MLSYYYYYNNLLLLLLFSLFNADLKSRNFISDRRASAASTISKVNGTIIFKGETVFLKELLN